MLSPFNVRLATFSIAGSVLLMTGCQTAISAQTYATISPPAQTRAVPLKFKRHNFEVHCYNTLNCSVIYNNNNFARPYLNTPTPAPNSSDYQKHWGTASYLGIQNFPAPAKVDWKSKDGATHEATVDIGAIFKEELIWHNVPISDMAKFYSGPVAGEPDIFLEVNDRTINVYMTTLIPTKTEQIPGNKNSFGRDDIFLAWSHTY
ncbi:hypothetical protein HDE76_000810 [Rhodanobacter sp. ANJX3]|uniref:hypothetical protein n=1 Tax=Rhodanobacter sp. ANJX3 TaxID=2723083 RepID=UPI00182920EE|nr:hypothetical protein [Rhodanobacter sp. ANJX3]MBB5357628.1 hypothetical protein [Rhodanobacter sp. ANJX3]